MSETMPEGVSRAEFDELAEGVKGLRGALDELREASTTRERSEARGEVREAKADLAATARELGLDPKRLEAAASKAKLEDERERLRPLLIELLDEELAEGAEGLEEAAEGALGAAAEVVEAAPKPDTAPKQSHWSDQPLSGLFK